MPTVRAASLVFVVVTAVAVAGVAAWSAMGAPGRHEADVGAPASAAANRPAAPIASDAGRSPASADVTRAAPEDRAATPAPAIDARHARASDAARAPEWPTPDGGRAGAQPAAGAAPAVPVALAFQALPYVGIDPAAEATWLRAIRDPNTPAEARSDLIEDLNEQGYHDNGRPTKADLPLLLARLQLIERLAPDAVDEVAAAAFAEAYKDLLEMYVRLGGELPTKR
ncbi:MAG: hypothetical protein JNM25_01370 [Planctomycetes bacterium]|nr:hypothetical protein [Planctomycetota bacterium]